mmetsp:Transcript_90797/g.220314  ORF Transcript_90797/g.220314 Transcript_90797/m.220314 type:complete len:266 (+) Transcript_90797:682-1479(+)
MDVLQFHHHDRNHALDLPLGVHHDAGLALAHFLAQARDALLRRGGVPARPELLQRLLADGHLHFLVHADDQVTILSEGDLEVVGPGARGRVRPPEPPVEGPGVLRDDIREGRVPGVLGQQGHHRVARHGEHLAGRAGRGAAHVDPVRPERRLADPLAQGHGRDPRRVHGGRHGLLDVGHLAGEEVVGRVGRRAGHEEVVVGSQHGALHGLHAQLADHAVVDAHPHPEERVLSQEPVEPLVADSRAEAGGEELHRVYVLFLELRLH